MSGPDRALLVAIEREQRWLQTLSEYVNAEAGRLKARGSAVHVMQTAAACQRIRAQ